MVKMSQYKVDAFSKRDEIEDDLTTGVPHNQCPLEVADAERFCVKVVRK